MSGRNTTAADVRDCVVFDLAQNAAEQPPGRIVRLVNELAFALGEAGCQCSPVHPSMGLPAHILCSVGGRRFSIIASCPERPTEDGKGRYSIACWHNPSLQERLRRFLARENRLSVAAPLSSHISAFMAVRPEVLNAKWITFEEWASGDWSR